MNGQSGESYRSCAGRHAAVKKAFRALTVFLCCVPALSGPSQSTSASAAPSQSPKSLGEELRHSEGKEIHIFYIHGIGSDGPKDRDSRALRKSICDYLKDCTAPEGHSNWRVGLRRPG